jgi:hypothetical protein
MWRTHAPTFNKWHKKKKHTNKKVTLHMLTHGAMRGCGLTSLVVCVNDKFCNIRERNVTIRSEIWTINIFSLGFQDIRECVTLWGLILQSLGCTLGAHMAEHTQCLIMLCWQSSHSWCKTKVGVCTGVHTFQNLPRCTWNCNCVECGNVCHAYMEAAHYWGRRESGWHV